MEKIRNYVNELFEDAPKNRKVRELKEEIIYNLEEKYDDLINDGKTEREAFKEVVASIGNIDELIEDLEHDEPTKMITVDQLARKKKTAFIVSISVAMYIVSLICIIITEELGLPDFVSMSAFFSIAGIATCLLIYHFMSQPKYEKIDSTMVEEFKEWKSEKNKNKAIKESINSIIWLSIVALYFIISLNFQNWHISWIIFLIGVVIQNIVELLFFGGKNEK